MRFFVDGSCRANGKANNTGGHAIIGIEKDDITDEEYLAYAFAQQEENTTNNIQELKSIIYVMCNFGILIKNEWSSPPIVYSDSAYCINTFTDWMFNWQKRGWLKSNNKPPENLDLIKKYYDLYQLGYRIELRKVKGHAGDKWNEVVDKLATGVLSTEEAFKLYGR